LGRIWDAHSEHFEQNRAPITVHKRTDLPEALLSPLLASIVAAINAFERQR
jgi:hypothetical protein